MFTTPGGTPASKHISANNSAVSGVSSAGFSTTVLPAAKAGATFHASISSGKFHGMICPQTPCARALGNSSASSVAQPAWWVKCRETKGRSISRDFPNGFAIVERLEHRKQAFTLLDLPRQCIKHAGAQGGVSLPSRMCGARSLNGGVHIGRARLCDLRKAPHRARGRAHRTACPARLKLPPMNRPNGPRASQSRAADVLSGAGP